MIVSIEETIKKINTVLDGKSVNKPLEVMQLSQAALNLAHVAATFDGIKNRS